MFWGITLITPNIYVLVVRSKYVFSPSRKLQHSNTIRISSSAITCIWTLITFNLSRNRIMVEAQQKTFLLSPNQSPLQHTTKVHKGGLSFIWKDAKSPGFWSTCFPIFYRDMGHGYSWPIAMMVMSRWHFTERRTVFICLHIVIMFMK